MYAGCKRRPQSRVRLRTCDVESRLLSDVIGRLRNGTSRPRDVRIFRCGVMWIFVAADVVWLTCQAARLCVCCVHWTARLPDE